MTTLMTDEFSNTKFRGDHPEAFELCICGLPRWRHPSTEEQRKIVAHQTLPTKTPHHMFIPPDLGDGDKGEVGPSGFVGGGSDPLAQVIFDCLRHTAHITTRGIRAGYIAQEMRIDGYVVMQRQPNGRFAKVGHP